MRKHLMPMLKTRWIRTIRFTRLSASLALAFALGLACTTRDTDSVRRADSTRAAAAQAPLEGIVGTDVPTPDVLARDSAPNVISHAGHGGDVELFSAAMLAHVGDSLARGRTTGHTLRSHDVVQYVQVRRVTSGVPEVHDRWIDVTLVQAGRGTLLVGGHVVGSHVESAGEHRGGAIEAGTAHAIAAGDLMMIPAGMPHQYRIAAGDSLRYLTTKVLDRSAR